ncbi:amidase [Primorskyibacter sp. S187A]|uniref:amidase n=1 Tax=Primorskyibacter sp. S187A TaxID=3415130 RepID=UPI003C7D7130
MADVMAPAHVLAAQLRAGRLKAVDVMAACYDQLEAQNGALNAVVSALPRDAAMALAHAADQSAPTGSLHGLPLAVKDLANAAGFPTSMGSPLSSTRAVSADDPHIARLRAAGALVFGKTNTPEFGLGSHSYNPVHGVTRNPFDPARSAGGSSGGAGVALACGMMPIADGSDMMGSLRNPAVWNGVYGLRPSFGRVPSEPNGDRFLNMLSTNGPMARCPEDLALLLDVMSGPDARQPHGRDLPQVTPALTAETGALRLGWLGDWGGAWPMEEGLLAAHEAALEQFEALGHAVTALPAPFDRDALWHSWIDLRSLVVAGSLRALAHRRDGLKPEALWELDRGLAFSGAEILRASSDRAAWYRTVMALFETYDALILPAAQVRPFPADWAWPREIAGVEMDSYHRWMEAVIPASLIGLPCLAVPAGLDRGLPFGLQIMGPPDSDARLLQIARDWHRLGLQPRPGP